MKNVNTFIVLLSIAVVCIQFVSCSEGGNEIVSARIESCPGCSLNRLHEVKRFIYDDVPLYENVEFKKIQGARPELLFLNKDDEEIKRIPLSSLTRQECNDLLTNEGFVKKDAGKNEF